MGGVGSIDPGDSSGGASWADNPRIRRALEAIDPGDSSGGASWADNPRIRRALEAMAAQGDDSAQHLIAAPAPTGGGRSGGAGLMGNAAAALTSLAKIAAGPTGPLVPAPAPALAPPAGGDTSRAFTVAEETNKSFIVDSPRGRFAMDKKLLSPEQQEQLRGQLPKINPVNDAGERLLPNHGITTTVDKIAASKQQLEAPPAAKPAPAKASAGGPGPMASMLLGATPKAAPAKPAGPNAMERAYGGAQDAARGAGQVAADKATAEAAYLEQSVKELEQVAGRQQERQAERDRFVTERTKQLETAGLELAEMQRKGIDPGRFMGSRDFGQKLAAGLGIMLGAVGAGLQRSGTNQPLALLMKFIDDDIDAQKSNLESAERAVGTKQNILGAYRQMFGDEVAAEAAARASLIDVARAKLAAMQARYSAPEALAKAKEAGAALEVEKQKALDEARQRWATISIQRQEAAAKGAATGGRPVTATEAAAVGGAEAALRAVDLIEAYAEDLPFHAPVSQVVPGTKASSYDDKQVAAAQVIGRFLEKGKLTDHDFPRYKALMPQQGDSAGRRAEKVRLLREMINAERSGSVSGLSQAGFDTSGFKQTESNPAGLPLVPKGR